ncbi:DEAD/DEAH box helicase, partial [archaeon]
FLIVCPATLLHHWVQEMHTWCAHMRTCVLHAISQTGREMGMLDGQDMVVVLKKMVRQRGLHTHTILHDNGDDSGNGDGSKPTTIHSGITIITTYDTLRRHHAALSMLEYTGVCLDEGQKIRNHHTQLHDICIHLPSYHRIILSGTPIQNSLLELWSLFRFVYPTRLGDVHTFEQCICKPIREGGYVNASRLQIRIGIECAFTLQNVVKPYLLRRRKDMLHLDIQLPKKTEHVIFVQLSPCQRKIYKEILESDEVHKVLTYKTPAFRAINTLRKLCNHPVLVYRQNRIQWQQEDACTYTYVPPNTEEEDAYAHTPSPSHTQHYTAYAHEGAREWRESGKLVVLRRVLAQWQGKQNNKVLIFCQTVAVLNIIECLVRQENYTYLRLDGETPIQYRARCIHQFNNDAGVYVMLLTTRTGGLGVSLTAANKVILFDPDWNPQTDIQVLLTLLSYTILSTCHSYIPKIDIHICSCAIYHAPYNITSAHYTICLTMHNTLGTRESIQIGTAARCHGVQVSAADAHLQQPQHLLYTYTYSIYHTSLSLTSVYKTAG